MSRPHVIGECVYCGTIEPPLDREHVLAFGLGGEMVLQQASCRQCSVVTQKIEQYCLRTMFGGARQLLGLRSRRPKERTGKLTLDIMMPDRTLSSLDLPKDEFPSCLALARFPEPRCLRGLPNDDVSFSWQPWVAFRPEKIGNVARSTKANQISLGELHPHNFARMLSKIAHCYLIRSLGLGNFKPLTVDYILHGTGSPNYFVGCVPEGKEKPAETDVMHHIRLTKARGILVVSVRLFAFLGAPTYHVVSGLLAGANLPESRGHK